MVHVLLELLLRHMEYFLCTLKPIYKIVIMLPKLKIMIVIAIRNGPKTIFFLHIRSNTKKVHKHEV